MKKKPDREKEKKITKKKENRNINEILQFIQENENHDNENNLKDEINENEFNDEIQKIIDNDSELDDINSLDNQISESIKNLSNNSNSSENSNSSKESQQSKNKEKPNNMDKNEKYENNKRIIDIKDKTKDKEIKKFNSNNEIQKEINKYDNIPPKFFSLENAKKN